MNADDGGRPDIRLNCWEAMACGRGPDDVSCESVRACPAANERRLNGVHGGRNAGRACWAVTGTLCGDRAPLPFSEKRDCVTCPFYHEVLEQELQTAEGTGFIFTARLRRMLDSEDSPRPAGK